jgi:putative FmdB family regulatory protein
MPTYSYTCDACGESFEKEQRIVEDPIKVCELCGKPQARRLIVSGNFILKGGGWYSDGYGSSSKSTASNAPSTGTSASTEKSTEKAADKPATADKPSTTDSGSKSGGGGTTSKAAAAE